MFCKEDGGAYNADYFFEKFRRHLKRHGLPHMRFHDLRHICASIYLDQSVSPKVIAQILGHSDISTTLSVYSYVMEKSSQEAVKKMGTVSMEGMINREIERPYQCKHLLRRQTKYAGNNSGSMNPGTLTILLVKGNPFVELNMSEYNDDRKVAIHVNSLTV